MAEEQKKNWLGPYIPEGNILREVIQQVKLIYHLMLDPRVHPLAKLIPIAAVAYIFLPVDLIPDMIPVLGQMDDAAIVMLGFRLFFEVAPPDVLREYLKRLAHPVSDSDWEVMQSSTSKPESESAPADEVMEGDFKLADLPDTPDPARPANSAEPATPAKPASPAEPAQQPAPKE